MDEITKELRVLVSLLSMRFPIAELNTTTGYSKGTISNYLSGKQAASQKFLNKVKETFEDDVTSFEFKKRFYDAIEHHNELHNLDINSFADQIGWEINKGFTFDDFMNQDNLTVFELIHKISFIIPEFSKYVNNHKRADIKGISLKKLTKFERTVFLKKDQLTEEDMIFFVKVIRKHRESLLEYPLFQKLIRSLAFTLEIDQEIEDFMED